MRDGFGVGPLQMGSAMRRGEIRFVDFNPSRGSETNKRRPAVVVSNDHANQAAERFGRGVVTVVPLTSNTYRVLSFQVLLSARDTGLSKDSKAQAEQVRAAAIETIGPKVGLLPAALLAEVDDALRLHLQL